VSSARVSLIVHHAVTMSRAALVELPTNMNAGPSPRIVTSKSDQTSESSPSPIPLSACLAAETDPWMSLVEMKPASPSGSSRSSPRASVVQRKSQSVCNPLLLRTLSEHETIPTTMERRRSLPVFHTDSRWEVEKTRARRTAGKKTRCRSAMSWPPLPRPIVDSPDNQGLIGICDAQLRAGRYEEAVTLLTQVIVQNGGNIYSFCQRSLAQFRLRMFEVCLMAVERLPLHGLMITGSHRRCTTRPLDGPGRIQTALHASHQGSPSPRRPQKEPAGTQVI